MVGQRFSFFRRIVGRVIRFNYTGPREVVEEHDSWILENSMLPFMEENKVTQQLTLKKKIQEIVNNIVWPKISAKSTCTEVHHKIHEKLPLSNIFFVSESVRVTGDWIIRSR